MLCIRRSLSRFVDSCPRPRYDTGCTYCEIPKFPADKQIDFDRNLNGTQPETWKHLLILSHGYPSMEAMPPRIELTPATLSSEINAVKRQLLSPMHPVAVSNVVVNNHTLPNKPLGPQEHFVYLYPDRKSIRFEAKDLATFIARYLVPEEKPEVYNPFKQEVEKTQRIQQSSIEFEEQDITDELVLICGHGLRDVRCGVMGPLLQREFDQVLTQENMLLHVKTGQITHVGGHAYAGNVVYFPRKGESVWYGRVFPEDVQGIVDTTIKQGVIIRDKYRGYVNGA